jgi:hypothetical protein
MVGIGSQQSGYVIEHKTEFAIDRVFGHGLPTAKNGEQPENQPI